VVGVEDHGVLDLPDDPENGDTRGVGSRSGESSEQHPQVPRQRVSQWWAVLVLATDTPRAAQAGARCNHVVLSLRCAQAGGTVQGVEDTIVTEQGSSVCSAVPKDLEEHLDLWCKAIPIHL
jgi:hypothetical protein